MVEEFKPEPKPISETGRHNLRVVGDFLSVIAQVMDQSDNPAEVVESAKAALSEAFKKDEQPTQE